MSNVLISFVGTGQVTDKDRREYRTTVYRFPDGTKSESSFFAHSIVGHYTVDRIILIGTVKSMWEEVYRVFAGQAAVDDTYLSLAEYTEKARFDDPLDLPQRRELEQAIGHDAKVILTKYGLDDAELTYNNELVLSLEQHLQPGDKLLVDVTHAFRSLPLSLLNALVYLQNISKKGVAIDNVLYGMYNQELKYAPVVVLNSVLNMSAWITGAQLFRDFGNAYQIADLLEADGEKSVAQRLRKFSDLLNLNHMGALRAQGQEISAFRTHQFRSPIAQMLIPPIVNEFAAQFLNAETQAVFQYRLACWQFRQKRYAPAFLSLREAIVTRVCETNRGYSWDNQLHRNEAKKCLSGKGDDNTMRVSQMRCQVYTDIRRIRNGSAHSMESTEAYDAMIRKLSSGIKALSSEIR